MRSIGYYWKEGLRNIFKHGFMSDGGRGDHGRKPAADRYGYAGGLQHYDLSIIETAAVQPDRSLDRRFAYHA